MALDGLEVTGLCSLRPRARLSRGSRNYLIQNRRLALAQTQVRLQFGPLRLHWEVGPGPDPLHVLNVPVHPNLR